MTIAVTKSFKRRGNVLYVRVQIGDEDFEAPLIVAEKPTKDGKIYTINELDKMVEDWEASRVQPETPEVDPDEEMEAVHQEMAAHQRYARGEN